MKLYPNEVTLQELCTAGHAINTAVNQERLLAKVNNMNPSVKAAMEALIATLAGNNTYYDAHPSLNYLGLANITHLTAGSTRTELLDLYPSLWEQCIYEQLNPGFWKMKTLGLWEVTPMWRPGMETVTDWVTYVDLNS
jgi:hypothetical protein